MSVKMSTGKNSLLAALVRCVKLFIVLYSLVWFGGFRYSPRFPNVVWRVVSYCPGSTGTAPSAEQSPSHGCGRAGCCTQRALPRQLEAQPEQHYLQAKS